MEEYYNNITIKYDDSLFVEYNNGDGIGAQILNIVLNNILENQENIYNFHYTALDETGEKRFVKLISYSINRHIKLIAWHTKTSGFLCNEKNITDKSGIEAHAGTYARLTATVPNTEVFITNPNNTILADGSMIFREDAQSAGVTTDPGFTIVSTEFGNYIFKIFFESDTQISGGKLYFEYVDGNIVEMPLSKIL